MKQFNNLIEFRGKWANTSLPGIWAHNCKSRPLSGRICVGCTDTGGGPAEVVTAHRTSKVEKYWKSEL